MELPKQGYVEICSHCGTAVNDVSVSRGEVVYLGLCDECIKDPKINPWAPEAPP
ncbi:hypothetical protein [Candidatus Bathycorpusculum sp.]|uniref:hypothetical protein n=1 Tax=Candidatus Bathycorpusculum sp. TaxID=2994959 RepID=UPI0028337C80|nr:hypothetical protein [Candidatus Termitimicrobium sp.]